MSSFLGGLVGVGLAACEQWLLSVPGPKQLDPPLDVAVQA